MTNKAATITATVNGIVFEGLTVEQAKELASLAIATIDHKTRKTTPQAAKPETKAQAKARETRTKYDAILDTKRIERMTRTATEKLASAEFEVRTMKQGSWVWVYPCGKSNGKGRTPEFKAVKLAKGWKYSPKRGAFYRDFS